MPIAACPARAPAATGRACRAVVATRLAHPGREFAALRALAFAWFTTDLLLDEDAAIATALAGVGGIDAAALVASLDSDAVHRGLRVRQGARPQRRRRTDRLPGQGGGQRRAGFATTAPSIVFETDDGRSLEAAGFQPLEAYDVLIANLDTTLERHAPPQDGPLKLLAQFPEGLCTQEIAVSLAAT